jgi:uncharacterized protein DUF4307
MDPAILAYRADKSCRADASPSKDQATVTGTNATTASTAPVFPPGRYGRRRAGHRRRRWIPAMVALVVIMAGLAVALRLYQQYGEGPYDTELVRYTDVSDSQVVIQFRVNLPTGKSATCAVRARNRAGVEVGRAEVRVPPDRAARPLLTYRLATRERPVNGEIQGCGPAN